MCTEDCIIDEAVELINQIKRFEHQYKSRIDVLQGKGCVLHRLYLCGGKALPGELCKELNITTPRMTAILSSLEDEQFIERKMSDIDRRKVIVSLTDKGKEAVLEHTKRQRKYIERLFNSLGEDDSENFLRILKKIRKFNEYDLHKQT